MSADSDTARKRDFGLDAIKALAIFLVCQTHYMHFSNTPLDNFVGITSCMGVPLFFMVNGALLLNRTSFDIHRHYQKTLRIVVLCVIWKVIGIVVQGIAWNIDFRTLDPGSVANFLIGNNTLDGFELGHFWYLYALAGIYCIYPLLKYAWDSVSGRIAVRYVLGIVVFFTFGLNAISLLWQIVCYIGQFQSTWNVQCMQSFYIFGPYGYCIAWFVIGGELYAWLKTHSGKTYCGQAVGLFFLGWLLLLALTVSKILYPRQFAL